MSCPVPPPTDGPAVSPVTSMAFEGRWKGSEPPTLADLTTTRVGGAIQTYVEAETEAELLDAVRAADEAGEPLLVLGGGSNLVASDDEFAGTVVRDVRSGIQADDDSSCAGALIKAPAGQSWDTLVAEAVENGWMGFEALSGIPGTVGATPIQNVGAYGQEVSETLSIVRVFDRLESRTRMFALGELKLGYRDSLLKRTLRDAEAGGGRIWGPTGRYVVLDVSFQARLATLSAPVRYAELARTLGVELEERVPSRDLRDAVLELRRGKGMVLDTADHDTWSSGSFFTNPILNEEEAAALPLDAPRYPVADHTKIAQIGAPPPIIEGLVKTSAAWLIAHSGFDKGFALPGSSASLSTKHVLALTNRGGANGREIRELANAVVNGVEETFGVRLVPEPVVL